MKKSGKDREDRGISYAKWGYLFILPFFVVYAIFTLYPQMLTPRPFLMVPALRFLKKRLAVTVPVVPAVVLPLPEH